MRLRTNGHPPQATLKRAWTWFKSLSRFGQIGLVVLAAHAAVILMLLVHHATARSPALKKPISIRSTLLYKPTASSLRDTKKEPPGRSGKKLAQAPEVQKPKEPTQPRTNEPKEALQPRTNETKEATQPSIKQPKKAEESSPKEPKQAVQPPQKEIKKVQQTNDQPKNSKEETKNTRASHINHDFLQQIADSLGAIASSTKVSKPSHFAPPLPSTLEIQTGVLTSMDRPEYGETVAAILQNSLVLPEFGQVVAKIEIDASGSVTQCEILETKSRKNGEFLKKRLQSVVFPCFNEFGLTETRINFTITFRNVENR